MCDFFSGIFDRQNGVLWIPGEDSHETILRHHAIPDVAVDPDRRNFVRFEITPPDGNVFEKDLSAWKFRVDERCIPSWWAQSCEESCWNALRRCLEECVFDGAEIDDFTNRNGLWLKDTNIKTLRNSQVREMRGSSQVGEMWGSSQVGVMRESSQVRVMWESSQVGVMWGSSQVGVMWGSSQVGVMRESSQVRVMWESSQVGVMRESSQVRVMWESSQVGVMRESSLRIERRPNGIYVFSSPESGEILLEKHKNKDN